MWQTKWRRDWSSRCTEISYPKQCLKLKLAVAISGLLLGISQGVWAQQNLYRTEAIYKGNRVVNACETLPVFSRPEIKAGSSGRPTRFLSFGDAAVVTSREKKYEVADSYPSSKKRQCRAQSGGSNRGEDEGSCNPNENFYERYEWFGISEGGYVPANCLVHEVLFGQQKAKRVANDAITLQGAAGKAKKKNKGQAQTCATGTGGVVTLLGAAGKAKKKKQGQICVLGFDDYLKALPQLNIFSDEMEAFLQEGKLGDFAG